MPVNTLDKRVKAKGGTQKTKEELKKIQDDMEKASAVVSSLRSIDRCQIEICRGCRKHASCFQRPISGNCSGFEAGLAWDHKCAEFRDDYRQK